MRRGVVSRIATSAVTGLIAIGGVLLMFGTAAVAPIVLIAAPAYRLGIETAGSLLLVDATATLIRTVVPVHAKGFCAAVLPPVVKRRDVATAAKVLRRALVAELGAFALAMAITVAVSPLAWRVIGDLPWWVLLVAGAIYLMRSLTAVAIESVCATSGTGLSTVMSVVNLLGMVIAPLAAIVASTSVVEIVLIELVIRTIVAGGAMIIASHVFARRFGESWMRASTADAELDAAVPGVVVGWGAWFDRDGCMLGVLVGAMVGPASMVLFTASSILAGLGSMPFGVWASVLASKSPSLGSRLVRGVVFAALALVTLRLAGPWLYRAVYPDVIAAGADLMPIAAWIGASVVMYPFMTKLSRQDEARRSQVLSAASAIARAVSTFWLISAHGLVGAVYGFVIQAVALAMVNVIETRRRTTH